MNTAVVIVGIDMWEQYTSLLVHSIRAIEPSVGVYVVDAGSSTPYPEVEGVNIIHQKTRSYAEAINLAANKAFEDGADWILSMNNDVSCLGKFSHIIDMLKPDSIYARQIIEENNFTWFGNWIVLIPREVWEKVGQFDPDYLVCGFEDADYSMRAINLGVHTKAIELPFIHHWVSPRWAIPGYPQTREQNIRRFTEKYGWRPGVNLQVTHD